MLTGHNYIVFLSGKYKGCDFPGHVLPSRNHHKPVCWYSMRRLWIPASLFCVPDVHSVSGYPVFSTDAVSVFSFPVSSPAFPDIRIRSHLHGFPLHILQSHLRFSFPALYSGVSYMPVCPHNGADCIGIDPQIHTADDLLFCRCFCKCYFFRIGKTQEIFMVSFLQYRGRCLFPDQFLRRYSISI